jgi:hypothetical protein
MIAIVWQFDVKPGREAEFELFYGVDGEWTAVNRHRRSYLGTSFLRDQNRAARYMVVEYWSEMVVHEPHRTFTGDETERLEALRSELDVPDRTGPTWSRRT